jgi:hypothetical protein
LDYLCDEFIKLFYGTKRWTYIDEIEYQNYINKFIKKQNKPIVFVGLNDNTRFGKNKKLYYNLQSQYNYYIEIDDMIVVKQKCIRLLNEIQNDKIAMKELINNNESFIKMFSQAIKKECSAKQTITMNEKWKRDYINQGYILMSRENIYKTILKIFKKF